MEADQKDLIQLLQKHLVWYPRMELADAYKLIYQGVMGPEHMVATQQEFARRLDEEFETLTPTQEQRLLEPVRADNTLFRINLRVYKSQWDNTHLLVPALLQTSKLVQGTKPEVMATWMTFIQLCEQSAIKAFQIKKVRSFSQWLVKEDYPIIHHSEVYRKEYLPAYRLISVQFITELGLNAPG